MEKSSEAKKWQGMNACGKHNVISTSHKLWRLFAVWVTGKVHGRSVFLDRSLTVFWYARFHSRPQSIHCCNFTMEVSTLPAKISDKSMVAWPMSCRVAWSGGLGPVYCFATQSATFCHCMSLALCFSMVQVRCTVNEETGCSYPITLNHCMKKIIMFSLYIYVDIMKFYKSTIHRWQHWMTRTCGPVAALDDLIAHLTKEPWNSILLLVVCGYRPNHTLGYKSM